MEANYIIAKKATKTGAEIYLWRGASSDSWGRPLYVAQVERAKRFASKDYAQLVAEKIGGYIKEI